MIDFTISLSSDPHLPLYERLYRSLSSQIRSGQLGAGQKLPGKRSLAEALAVSVNTVDTAYQLLTAEGYLEVRPKSGFYVLPVPQTLPKAGLEAASPCPALPQGNSLPQPRFDLSTGGVDTSLFPFRTWGRIQKELLYSSPQLLTRGPSQGDEELRAEIAEYLRAYRGVHCRPNQIVIGAGIEYLLGLLAPLLQGPAAVENPGYRRTRTILENNGLACLPVDIDREGLSVKMLAESGAQVAYVTPSHQFPTGLTMPAGRRGELLRWAGEKPGRWIIEDDYDSEFRFDLRPLPSLQGMGGPGGPVIYLTTFSKSLAPSIRIAAMVLPDSLLLPYRQRYSVYSCTVSRFEQQTLCEFIRRGHFSRHLARLRSQYKGRMESLREALNGAFGPELLELEGTHTGLHLLMRLKRGPGEEELAGAARAGGVPLGRLSDYYMCRKEKCPARTLVLGYAALPPERIGELVGALQELWRPLLG